MILPLLPSALREDEQQELHENHRQKHSVCPAAYYSKQARWLPYCVMLMLCTTKS